jgi:hypothetical protein
LNIRGACDKEKVMGGGFNMIKAYIYRPEVPWRNPPEVSIYT